MGQVRTAWKKNMFWSWSWPLHKLWGLWFETDKIIFVFISLDSEQVCPATCMKEAGTEPVGPSFEGLRPRPPKRSSFCPRAAVPRKPPCRTLYSPQKEEDMSNEGTGRRSCEKTNRILKKCWYWRWARYYPSLYLSPNFRKRPLVLFFKLKNGSS